MHKPDWKLSTVSCSLNPDSSYLYSVGGDRQRSPIDRDYIIPGLETLLANPSLETAKLVWRTMSSSYRNILATCRQHSKGTPVPVLITRIHNSSITCESAWVPKVTGCLCALTKRPETYFPMALRSIPVGRGSRQFTSVYRCLRSPRSNARSKTLPRSSALPTARVSNEPNGLWPCRQKNRSAFFFFFFFADQERKAAAELPGP